MTATTNSKKLSLIVAYPERDGRPARNHHSRKATYHSSLHSSLPVHAHAASAFEQARGMLTSYSVLFCGLLNIANEPLNIVRNWEISVTPQTVF
jgi:hypothetical protein